MECVATRTLIEGSEFAEIAASVAEARDRRTIWAQMWPELLAAHPRKYVALVGQDVVAVREDLFEMWDHLHSLGLRPPDDVAVEYIYDGSEKFIL